MGIGTLIGNIGGGASISPGSFLARQVLTAASGTYTPTAGTKRVRISLVGGGGGGGGALGGITQSSWGGGGSSGVYVEKWIDPGATITGGAYVCGAAGAGGDGTPSNGGVGGDTTIDIQGTTYTAKGGLGGIAMPAGSLLLSVLGGGAAAGSSVGDITTGNAPGAPGVRVTAVLGTSGNGGTVVGGAGGAGGAGVITEANGNPGLGNGGGGGGAGSAAAVAKTGGAGTIGKIIVDEYA